MEIINEILDEEMDLPENTCVFDIETTGFDTRFNKVVLIGVLYKSKSKLNIKQFFADSNDDEKELLFYFKELLKDFDTIVTYNGISFDVPFLERRALSHNMKLSFENIHHLDLLKMMRTNKNTLGLEDCKLKTVEKLALIDRLDTISGKESVELYKEFLSSKDMELKKKILLHNYEDIHYLARLYCDDSPVSRCIDKSIFSVEFFNHDFKAYLLSFKIQSKLLKLDYLLSSELSYPIEISHGLFEVNASGKFISVSISLKKISDGGSDGLYFPGQKPFLIKNSLPAEQNIHALGMAILKNLDL